MWEKKSYLLWLAAIVFLMSGCEPVSIAVGGAALGTGTGTYYYVHGEMQTDYYSPFDKVWAACEKTMADMRALRVEPYKEIGKGTIAAVINDENVKFIIQYKEKNLTNVAVRVGMFGNRTASQLLQDKIGDNIKKN
jgi:hypothetical protein